MDNLTKEQRCLCMSHIKSRNTKVELNFRKYVWGKGFKGYKINSKIIGKPDLYFSKKKIAVFIDGCFWHKCPICFVKPKTKNKYWDVKINNNILRDKKINMELDNKGISVIRFWEHELKKDINKCYIT